MSKYIENYLNHLKNMLDDIEKTQMNSMDRAAGIIADAIESGNTIYAFGASHAGILAEELFYRTGGLALINPIFSPTLMLNTRPVTITSQMERLEGFGKILLNSVPIDKGDVLIIHSVSGRNAVSIEMALKAKELGARVIVITNLNYSKSVTSRHSSGKLLYKTGDVVIDNCGDFEDSSIKIEGMEQKIAPTSTATGAAIVNSVVLGVVEKLLQKGITPPVFHSANVDGGDEFNKRIFDEYRDRIHYL